MSSKSGTKPTETNSRKSDLSSQDIEVILGACAKHGVSELQFRGMTVKFGMTPDSPSGARGANSPVEAMTDKDHARNTKDALEKDELEFREEQLAELQITDPSRYEELVRDGELDEDDTEPAGDE